MPTVDDLRTITAQGKARQLRARELNRRAGEDIFPVMTREQLCAFALGAMAGARSAAEVEDLAALELPPLDAEREAAVLRDCPDTVTLLGEERPVEYRGAGYAPKVVLRFEQGAGAKAFALGLPDELLLPGGRAVEVEVRHGYYTQVGCSTDGSELRRKVREHLNEGLWNSWTNRPVLSIPDPADAGAAVPPIAEAEYGRCVVTDEPLVAYGTVETDYYGRFAAQWFRSRSEADAAREKTVAKLEELRAAACAKARGSEVRSEAERLRERCRELAREATEFPEGRELATRIHDVGYAYFGNFGEIAAYVERTPAFIAEVERALGDLRARKAREEAAERAKLAPIFEALPEASLEEAQKIRAFADICARLAGGGLDVAIRKVARELNAEYGAARRQEGLRNAFPGLDRTEEGDGVLRLYRRQDLDTHLKGALAWLNSLDAPAPAAPKSGKARPSAPKQERAVVTSGGLDVSQLAGKYNVRTKSS